jgi:nitroimidazol reductase NimA-like FMN-containing flavoprotein (pyridoxamine 5'-phosphate oxidase superfamily)
MTAPATELDVRFSDPAASAVDWNATRQVLEDAQLFWITTVRADGRPHVSPLVGVWFDDALYFATGETEQKAHNLRANPSVILTTGCNTWDRGTDVVVEGTAVPVEDETRLKSLAEAWSRKWDGRWSYDVRAGRFHHDAGEALVFGVTPAKVLTFGKAPFSHTRYRF